MTNVRPIRPHDVACYIAMFRDHDPAIVRLAFETFGRVTLQILERIERVRARELDRVCGGE